MEYDLIIIGGGLSGLTAASLLAKRRLKAAVVDRDTIPQDTAPVEILVGNPDALDESEITAYILSIDDRTLCAQVLPPAPVGRCEINCLAGSCSV